MISEPEMPDEQGSDIPGDLLSGPGDPGTGAVGVRTPRGWLWGVGGVVVASAVWGAVMHGTGTSGPDLHGYHLSGNPCSSAAFDPLKKALGQRDFAVSNATVSKGPALDKLSCLLSTRSQSDDAGATTYSIYVSVDLHKKSDPRAEFENARDAKVSTLPGNGEGNGMLFTDTGFTSAADVHPVTGIGDEAYLLTGDSTGQTLEVLHGGAVLTLQLSGYNDVGVDSGASPEDLDLTRFRSTLTTTMRHLMTSLAS